MDNREDDGRAVRVDEDTFRGAGGVLLRRRSVLPQDQGSIWARLGVLHGYGDHSGRYAGFMEWMAGRGVACHSLDFRGHGLSAGRRGFVARWDEYLGDLDAFLRLDAVRADASSPLFLLGQSHGGLVLARAQIQKILPGVAGGILCAPYLRASHAVPRGTVVLARVSNVLVPWLRVPTRLRSEWMSSDETMRREAGADPLTLRTATPRWYLTTLRAQSDTLRRAPEFDLPLLVLTGDDDPVADPRAAREFFDRAGSADKIFRVYPGHRHEPLREADRETVFGDVLRWLGERTGHAATPGGVGPAA